jgi:hypothetical protein
MPGPLPNVKQEKFVQALFEGHSATESYTLAGYRPHQGNSSRLRWFDMVQTRLTELQSEAAKASEVTVQSLLNELEEARTKATNLDQLSAAVRATEVKARVSGLMVSRVEQKIDLNIESYEAANSVDAAALLFAKHFADDVLLSDAEHAQLAEMVKEACQRMSDFVKACRVKPMIAGHSQRQIELRRLTNGKANGR